MMSKADTSRKTKAQIELELASVEAELRDLRDRGPIASAVQQQMSETLHSLQVHQEELNTQNEQLRLTQISLEQTSQKYHDLFENSPAGYFIIDTNYSVQEVNVAGMEMLGRTKGRILAKPFLLFVDKSCRRTLDEHFLQVRNGSARTELWLLPEQRPPFPVILQSVPLGSSWGESWRCLTTAFDITDRKAAEQALFESETRFRAIFEQNPMAVQIVDANGVPRMSNRAWTRLWGRNPSQGGGIVPQALEMSRHLEQARNGQSIDIPAVRIPAQGRDIPERWVHAHIYPIQSSEGSDDTVPEIVVVHEEITERKRIEIDLKERTERLQRQYNNLRALSEIAALPGGFGAGQQLAAALNLGRRHLGLTIGQITRIEEGGSTIEHHSAPPEAGIVDGTRIDLSETFCAQVIETGNVLALPDLATSPYADHPSHRLHGVGSYLGAPIRQRGRDYGTIAFYSAQASARGFDEGDIEFMRLLSRLVGSVLEQDENRRDLAQSNAELEQFAYVASHDLRQPLRQVSSYVSLLQRRYGEHLDDTAREFIAFAHDGAVRMDRLIVDLLEYSRIGRNTKPVEPVELSQVVADASANLSASLAESGGTIEVTPPLPTVRGDSTDLVRLFQNLIGNAIKYRAPDRPPLIRISSVSTTTEHHISVSDNGIGIESDYFETIFRIFQRLHTPDKYEGTGIGLAICKKVVEQHQGRIWVESNPGQGTTFTIALPNRP
ncbi:PAS domain S-box-containing protein [Magnetospirillum fulvum]|uniref:histidine kinase n=2 Tax=Magnetospirillum fulvum TaxID=1082 RepID=A0A1H6GN75_MAGFU|nr:PAS domain S-box-containing protein [Magnetospirillum fulvum]